MLSNYDNFLFNTREECCKTHYEWNINECLGNSLDAGYVGTEKWWVDWDSETCIQDCEVRRLFSWRGSEVVCQIWCKHVRPRLLQRNGTCSTVAKYSVVMRGCGGFRLSRH